MLVDVEEKRGCTASTRMAVYRTKQRNGGGSAGIRQEDLEIGVLNPARQYPLPARMPGRSEEELINKALGIWLMHMR